MCRKSVLVSTAVLCACAVLFGSAATAPIHAKNGTNLLTAEEMATIRTSQAWSGVNTSAVITLADRWMKYTPQQLRDMVPPASVPRAFDTHFLQCPQHSEEIKAYGSYPWIIDPDRPYKLICPVGGEAYPTNDFDHHHHGGPDDVSSEPYVDTGWGWRDPNHPQKYWFVAYYAHWLYHAHLRPAAVALGQAYVLTGDVRYATQGAALLDRIAEEYPDMDHVKQSRYGTEIQVGTYQGRILNCIWETGMARDLAVAYDYVYSGMDGNRALEEATGKSIARIRHPEDIAPAKADDHQRGHRPRQHTTDMRAGCQHTHQSAPTSSWQPGIRHFDQRWPPAGLEKPVYPPHDCHPDRSRHAPNGKIGHCRDSQPQQKEGFGAETIDKHAVNRLADGVTNVPSRSDGTS